MKKTFEKHVITLCLLVTLVSCGTSSQTARIIIKEEPRKENFTNDMLRNFMKKTSKPAIVVRSTGVAGSLSSSSGSDRMCSILEMALAKYGFDVRDRSLFEAAAKTIEKTNPEEAYSALYEATHVDLLMEISNYSLSDYYSVNGYYDDRGGFYRFPEIKEDGRRFSPRYLFRGMSLTLKIIVLKDNIVGGSYTYSYVPCSEASGGAVIVQMYPLRYKAKGDSRDIDAVLDDRISNGLLESREQRLDRAMERFISDEVVPSLIEDMRGTAIYRGSYNTPKETLYQTTTSTSSSSNSSNIAFNNSSAANNLPENNSDAESTLGSFMSRLVKKVENESKTLENSSLENEKQIEEVLAQFSEIIPVNSAGLFSEKVRKFIQARFDEQVNEKLSKLKKDKDIAKFNDNLSKYKTDLDKLKYLSEKNTNELNEFVDASCSPVGTKLNEDSGLIFYLPMRILKTKNDYALYFFIDGQCYGVGTFKKGLYVNLEKTNFSDDFHKVEIIAAGNESVREVFNVNAHFDIRDKFIFKSTDKYKDIKTLELE
ncbi:MAG: hypothetical protein SPL35_00355 [Bacteroidales bacterium]|nr:hypothetical protein [Bacteroidales bacterium]